jgi:hypothetical protein
MYWRVRKYDLKDTLKHYGVHIALGVSLFMNMWLMITRPNPNRTVGPEVKQDIEAFARRVTQHILDTSYISYENSTAALMTKDHGELSLPVVNYLQRTNVLPRDANELKATLKTYAAQRRVAAVRIDDVSVNQNDMDKYGRIPVVVTGLVAVHSAQEADPGPVPFRFRYIVGANASDPQALAVASFQDLSPSPR